MVSTLPERPDLDQLRRQAKELRTAVAAGDPHAAQRLSPYSSRRTLAAAQLAIAREHGFTSWTRLNVEVRRKRLIEAGDVAGLRTLLAQQPELATARVSSTLSARSSSVLDYVAVARFHGSLDRDVAGDITRVLLDAGARPDGPGGPDRSGDTPLVTAASYGEVDMVRALLAAGADVEAVGTSIPGGGTALAHAVHYGMPTIVDLLVGAGAVVHGIVEAAGVGSIPAPMLHGSSAADLVAALRAASVCGRLEAIDRLLGAGVDPNATIDGGTCLHWAAWEANAASIEYLLGRGADPTRHDDVHDMTPGQWYLYRRNQLEALGNPDCRYDRQRIERALEIAA
jgi:ankyrin repeat protein